jgi:hypothetical protein
VGIDEDEHSVTQNYFYVSNEYEKQAIKEYFGVLVKMDLCDGFRMKMELMSVSV